MDGTVSYDSSMKEPGQAPNYWYLWGQNREQAFERVALLLARGGMRVIVHSLFPLFDFCDRWQLL